MTFAEVLDKHRKLASSERDKGDRFERLIQRYFRTDKKYRLNVDQIWLWNEFPFRDQFGHVDTGIDLVVKAGSGDYWAIQCKCYSEDTYISKASVDGFLSTSGRSFEDEQGRTIGFSRRYWVSTTTKWSSNASEALRNQYPEVNRLSMIDLEESGVDWGKLNEGFEDDAAWREPKSLYTHQVEALNAVSAHFNNHDRGKLIMACGTGKTFNALRIAEEQTNGRGLILFLVPSIALLAQSLREWNADVLTEMRSICVCSDPRVSKKRQNSDADEGIGVLDLALPASTNHEHISRQIQELKQSCFPGMTVVFSTYQSIKVISDTQDYLQQKLGMDAEFDLIICDEAHRTTGVSLAGQDESAFTKVHDNDFIRAKKRLYMTATPRLYSDDSKSKAAKAEAVLCSMDDEQLYGAEIYRIGFGEAVEKDLLTDYKVLVLTLNDKDVPPAIQRMISDKEIEISTDDTSKLIGCVNALSKQFIAEDSANREIVASDPAPMRRAVAFCPNIRTSTEISKSFNVSSDVYLDHLPDEAKKNMVSIESKHIDGTMSAPTRDELLSWLKADTTDDKCRVITNVRVLSEGVDVPSLDAVLFLSARNSQVDVVQSVGRVMRKAPGKKYGYIIIPVMIPSDVEAEKALDSNERYKVVWTVLNALRAHDDRFNATVNKIELNKSKPGNILIGRPDYSFDENGNPIKADKEADSDSANSELARQLYLQFEQLQGVIYARMVEKVGDRRYWEQWAKDVAQVAERQTERIRFLIKERSEQRAAFEDFLAGLQKNINPSISEEQSIDMLAQHIITKPIFEALFEGYSFVKSNAVSLAMQGILDTLQGEESAKDSETLQKFYNSVKRRAEGIDNAEGKQRIIIELYDKFFKSAFPKMVEQLGIVYTPVEVVDFIIHSVNDVLKQEFDSSLSDENVHILDPFTGTGTFITRLLQSGLIKQQDLERKYRHEIHANEIVLLAYYIAAVNIENAFHDLMQQGDNYEPFEGIVLTDTFQLGEAASDDNLMSGVFPHNSARVKRQRNVPVKVIFGNPPYSVGQKSANDNAQNLKYERLDARIAETYAAATKATNKNSLYDSYIKAFRWASDRIDNKTGGVIAFVSNGAWLDGNSSDGFRKVIEKEFSKIWVFNLRGNARTQGEQRKKESGNVFGSGSRTPIAITILVKKSKQDHEVFHVFYRDIGDYLTTNQKLKLLVDTKPKSLRSSNWRKLKPDPYGDWLNLRSESFELMFVVEPKKKFDQSSTSLFIVNSRGIQTARDAYCYNSSKLNLEETVSNSLDYYNSKRLSYHQAKNDLTKGKLGGFLEFQSNTVSWSSGLKDRLVKNEELRFFDESITKSMYRPFFRQFFYFARELNERVYQFPKIFPFSVSVSNVVICLSGPGGKKEPSVFITDCIPDLHLNGDTQCFPLYYYEKNSKTKELFDNDADGEYTRRDGISNFILNKARNQYGAKNINKEDIFYYVYGFLHSPEYRETFANDLKKMLPRLPLVEDVRDFWAFSKAGRKLADLHINYESVTAYPDAVVKGAESGHFRVEKMRFLKKDRKDTIKYNSSITVSNIPAKAYEYIVNGKSAIEWIVERYQVKTDKKSGITNDPNDWADEVGNPRYILDLLLSIVNVSVQSVDIVKELPSVAFE